MVPSGASSHNSKQFLDVFWIDFESLQQRTGLAWTKLLRHNGKQCAHLHWERHCGRKAVKQVESYSECAQLWTRLETARYLNWWTLRNPVTGPDGAINTEGHIFAEFEALATILNLVWTEMEMVSG